MIQNVISNDVEANSISMSALGQKETLRRVRAMSALPPKADMAELELSFSFAKLASDYKESADRLATVALPGWFASPAPDFSFRLGTNLA